MAVLSAPGGDGEALLSPEARALVARAREMPLSYGVRVLVAPGARPLVVLGEAHVKLGAAHALGREIVSAFALRGVETFPADRITLGRALRVLIHGPRLLLRALTLGAVKGSTITCAKALSHGETVELERAPDYPLGLHVMSVYLTLFFALAFGTLGADLVSWALGPGGEAVDAVSSYAKLALALVEVHMILLLPPAILLRRKAWAWMVHPLVAIVGARDKIMADGAAQMMRDRPEVAEAIAVMGRAHLPGFERELTTRHGFTRAPEG